MRLALYHPWVYLRSGVERWMVELIGRSRHEWTVYTHHYEPEATYPEVRELRVVRLEPEVSVKRSLGPLVHAGATLLRARLPQGHDALLVSSEGLGDLVALRSPVPVAAYCHTPLKILHDPAASSVVRQSLGKRTALRTIGPLFEAVDRRAWRHYSYVLANSSETAARIEAARLLPSGPVEVLTPGVSDTWWSAPIATGREPVLLYAGRIMWQKNIELAIDTVRELGGAFRLVVAGMVDVKSQPYLAQLRERAAGLPVTFEIAPPDERMRRLYSEATALLFTPRNEDFGMVVLEAMAAGTPVLAVDAGGPTGIVDHGVDGWLLPPTPGAFARQVRAADFEQHREAARRTAQHHGWNAHVGRLDEVMEQLAQQGSQLGRRV